MVKETGADMAARWTSSEPSRRGWIGEFMKKQTAAGFPVELRP